MHMGTRVEIVDVGLVYLESFHFESTTMFLQPVSLVRVFLRDRLSLLLAREDLTVIEAMNQSKGVSDGQQTDLVAEVTPESLFEYIL